MRTDSSLSELDLKAPDIAGRYDAMIGLEAAGRLGEAALRALCLDDLSPFIRKRALRIAGESRGGGFLPVLCEALGDGDPIVRTVAAEQISALAIAERGIALGHLLEPLFHDPDPGVRGRALSLMTQSDERQGAQILVDLFVESLAEPDGESPSRIATLLGRVWSRRAERRLRKRLDGLGEEIVRRAARALDRGGIRLS